MPYGGLSNNVASETAIQAESTARQARTSTELMQHDIDRLLLITEAMWTILKQQHGLADDALTKIVGEIELKRSNVNGVPVKDPPVACPACGRPNMASRQYCIYCGKQILGNPFAH